MVAGPVTAGAACMDDLVDELLRLGAEKIAWLILKRLVCVVVGLVAGEGRAAVFGCLRFCGIELCDLGLCTLAF